MSEEGEDVYYEVACNNCGENKEFEDPQKMEGFLLQHPGRSDADCETRLISVFHRTED